MEKESIHWTEFSPPSWLHVNPECNHLELHIWHKKPGLCQCDRYSTDGDDPIFDSIFNGPTANPCQLVNLHLEICQVLKIKYKDEKQAEAEVVPSSSSVKAKLSLVKLLFEIKLSFSSDF